MHIREADIGEVEAISRLVNRAYRPVPGTEGWTHEATLVSGHRVASENIASAIQNSTVLVGIQAQGLVACVQIEMDGKIAHIGMLAVDPSFQTCGIGKSLLKGAEELAVQKFGAEASVLIVVAARSELVAFYLRRGYRQTGEQFQYPVDAGVGTPVKEAMLLTKLVKCLTLGK